MRLFGLGKPKPSDAELLLEALRSKGFGDVIDAIQPADIDAIRVAALEGDLAWKKLPPGEGAGRRGTASRCIVDNPFLRPWGPMMEEGKFAEVLAEMNKPYSVLLGEMIGESVPMTETDLEYISATVKTTLAGGG